MTKRLYFVAHGGTVQGVGFRQYTQRIAQNHGITGWCRNTHDNKVEGEAQGSEGALQRFMKDVHQGPRHAKVVDFTTEEKEVASEESSFDVRH